MNQKTTILAKTSVLSLAFVSAAALIGTGGVAKAADTLGILNSAAAGGGPGLSRLRRGRAGGWET